MSAPEETPRRSRWTRYLPVLVIAALCVALVASGALRHLSLAELREHRAWLIDFVARHPVAALAAYCAAYFLIVVACVPGPSVMSVTGGFLFGPVVGGAMALASLVTGGGAVFLACRTAFGDWAARRAGPTIGRIEAGFSRDAFSYLLALRLMPIAPFFLVNLASGLARVRFSTFLTATLIGSAPSVFIFAGLGAGLEEMFLAHEKLDAHFFSRPEVALPLTGLAMLSLGPALWRLWRTRAGKPAA